MKRHRPELPQVAAASAFVVALLSMIVFITLFRAPMPVDAFAALGGQIAGAASESAAS